MISIESNGGLSFVKGLDSFWRERLTNALTFTNLSLLYEAKSTNRNIESRFCLFAQDCFPTGLLSRVVKELDLGGINPSIEYQNPIIQPVRFELPEFLRAYQTNALLKALETPRGILEMVTGGGKTLTAITYIQHFPHSKILFTVPNVDLLHQTRLEMSKYLGEEIGMIGASHKEWQRVTVGVINSLATLANEGATRLAEIDVVIHDEAHSAGSQSYLTLSCALTKQTRVLGLSATPERNDGADLVVEGVCGPIICKVSAKEVAAVGAINLPTYYQVKVGDRYLSEKKRPPIIPKCPTQFEILKLYTYAIINNTYRNDTIVSIVKRLFNSTRRQGNILVMFDYLNHGTLLQSALAKADIDAPIVHGKTPAKERKTIVANFTNGNLPVLLGSSILKQGVDFPELEYLVLAGSSSAQGNHWQKVGRALRTNSSYEKIESTIIDFQNEDYFFRRRAERRWDAMAIKYSAENCHLVKNAEELFTKLNV